MAPYWCALGTKLDGRLRVWKAAMSATGDEPIMISAGDKPDSARRNQARPTDMLRLDARRGGTYAVGTSFGRVVCMADRFGML
jgi:hypothetical protein